MLTEFLIFSPLLILNYINFIGYKTILMIFSIYYWLPKIIFINLLNYYFPSVLTNNKNKKNKIYLTFDDVPYIKILFSPIF